MKLDYYDINFILGLILGTHEKANNTARELKRERNLTKDAKTVKN